MSGARSIKRSMDREERTLDAQDRAIHRELHGNDDLPQKGNGEEPMDNMAARDVIVNINSPLEKPAAETSAEKPAKTLLERAAPLLLGAAVGVPPLTGLATYFLTRPDPTPPPAVESPAPGYEYSGRPFTPGQD